MLRNYSQGYPVPWVGRLQAVLKGHCICRPASGGHFKTPLEPALAAEGQSEIDSLEIILRGYENLEKKLRTLGAEIKIQDT